MIGVNTTDSLVMKFVFRMSMLAFRWSGISIERHRKIKNNILWGEKNI